MKADDIDRFIDRWRTTLPPVFTPDYVDGFMRRHRGELDALVLKTLARRGAEGGEAADEIGEIAPEERLPASEPEFPDSETREEPRQTFDLLECQELGAR